MECIVPGCPNAAAPRMGGKCHACVKALQRCGTVVRKRRHFHPSPMAMVLEAALALAEVDAMDKTAWRLAKQRMRTAMRRYVRHVDEGCPKQRPAGAPP